MDSSVHTPRAQERRALITVRRTTGRGSSGSPEELRAASRWWILSTGVTTGHTGCVRSAQSEARAVNSPAVFSTHYTLMPFSAFDALFPRAGPTSHPLSPLTCVLSDSPTKGPSKRDVRGSGAGSVLLQHENAGGSEGGRRGRDHH